MQKPFFLSLAYFNIPVFRSTGAAYSVSLVDIPAYPFDFIGSDIKGMKTGKKRCV